MNFKIAKLWQYSIEGSSNIRFQCSPNVTAQCTKGLLPGYSNLMKNSSDFSKITTRAHANTLFTPYKIFPQSLSDS